MRHCLFLFFVLLLATTARAAPMLVGVYESETNAVAYHQLNRADLRGWLETNGYAFESFGDAPAADDKGLAQYAAIIVTNCYLVPDAACRGLRDYVQQGGALIWIDAPARCTNRDLLDTLGIAPEYSYLEADVAHFQETQASAAIAGVGAFTDRAIGNPALKARGAVLAEFAVEKAQTKNPPVAFPAVLQNRSGSGVALLLNWSIWTGAPQSRAILERALHFVHARQLLKTQPTAAFLQAASDAVAQPQRLAAQAVVFARPEFATQSVVVQARLQRAPSPATLSPAAPVARPVAVKASGVLKLSASKEESYAAMPLGFATSQLLDGDYEIALDGKMATQQLPSAAARVSLYGELWQRLRREESKRAKLLRLLLTGTLGDYAGAPRTPAGRTDIPKLLDQIAAAHMNTYDFLIYPHRHDWDDFQGFVQQAQQKKIKVWVTLLPPSEPPPSEPFQLDYIRWAQEIGKLSQRYDCIAGVVIDDFWSAENQTQFTPAYIARFAATLRSYNPKLAFLPVVYWGTIGDEKFLNDFGPAIDGIMFPYADVESAQDLTTQLQACRRWIGQDKLLLINVYASGTSGPKEKAPRTPQYLREVLSISHRLCDGIRLYVLPKNDYHDPRFAVAAELYGQWNQGPLPR